VVRRTRFYDIAESMTPAPYTVLGWNVADINSAVDGLAAKGIAFQVFPGMGQDQRHIWNSPSGARVVWFCDPDGNVLSPVTRASAMPITLEADKYLSSASHYIEIAFAHAT